jgi:lysophospholipase L1-like esterase
MRRLVTRQLVILATALLLIAGGFGASRLIFPMTHAHAASQWVGPKHYYLGLGDSLAFGFQPDLDWSHGYVQDFYSNLQSHGVASLTNYGCNGETSNTMINGGCPYQIALHNYYLGAQLNAAVGFLHSHAGQVSPVTLDMGANDLIPDINSSTCSVSATWATDLANLRANLANTILPQITAAMKDSSGNMTGDLVMMNYYDPYSKSCPNSLTYVQQLNATISSVAAQFGVHVADVYSAFGGAGMANNICSYTWICNWLFHDIHATDAGYQVIANTFAATTGY